MSSFFNFNFFSSCFACHPSHSFFLCFLLSFFASSVISFSLFLLPSYLNYLFLDIILSHFLPFNLSLFILSSIFIYVLSFVFLSLSSLKSCGRKCFSWVKKNVNVRNKLNYSVHFVVVFLLFSKTLIGIIF